MSAQESPTTLVLGSAIACNQGLAAPRPSRGRRRRPAGGLGRRFPEERQLYHIIDALHVGLAPAGVEALRIVALLLLCQAPDDRVDDHAARPGIERDGVLWSPAGGQIGQVGDPADVLDDAGPVIRTEQYVIRPRHQRRPLPAYCQVGGAEISNHGRACLSGDDRGFTDLIGAARVVIVTVGHVANGLPVRANGSELIRPHAGLFHQLAGARCKFLAKLYIEPCEVFGARLGWRHDRQQSVAEGLGILHVAMGDELDAHFQAAALDFDECGINAVAARAAHQSNEFPSASHRSFCNPDLV